MKTIRIHLCFFIILLLLSGITAFPLKHEISLLNQIFEHQSTTLARWIQHLHRIMYATSDIMFYGTDWLAFAHVVIALFFIPVFIHPQKHKVNVVIGMVACALVLPLAFICGPVRGIPFFHQLIDCAFGVFGFMYLALILRKINHLTIQIQ